MWVDHRNDVPKVAQSNDWFYYSGCIALDKGLLNIGYKVSAIGYWALGIGHYTSGIYHWALGIGHQVLVIRHWAYRVLGIGTQCVSGSVGYWVSKIGRY